MAPSERQIVTAVLGLLSGFAVTWYLLWWRRRGPPPNEPDVSADDNSTQNATATEADQSVSVIRELALADAAHSFLESRSNDTQQVANEDLGNNVSQNAREQEPLVSIEPELADASRSLLASQTSEGSMTVSQSWAILNGNSDTSSPRLSPVASVDQDTHIADEEDEIEIESSLVEADTSGDNTAVETQLTETEDIVLESPPDTEDTVLLSTSELQFATLDDVAIQYPTVEDVSLQYDELLKEHKETTEAHNITRDEITAAISASQTPELGLTERNAEVLVWLILHDNAPLKQASVQGIARCATFTNNQDVLREQGCIPQLGKLLELQRMALWLQHSNADTAVSTTINAVNNLAVNEQNNKEMEACVPTLVDISLDKDTGEAVCLSSLQALTNLSVTSEHHGHYTRLVQRLYELLSTGNTGLKLQALKVLINLSCNPDMVPHLLAAKAPTDLLDLLNPSRTDEAVILRFVTLLTNVLNVVKMNQLTSSSLPSADKAASPETMYSELLGLGNVGNLKNKVFLLCKHTNEDIKSQAAKVYGLIK